MIFVNVKRNLVASAYRNYYNLTDSLTIVCFFQGDRRGPMVYAITQQIVMHKVQACHGLMIAKVMPTLKCHASSRQCTYTEQNLELNMILYIQRIIWIQWFERSHFCQSNIWACNLYVILDENPNENHSAGRSSLHTHTHTSTQQKNIQFHSFGFEFNHFSEYIWMFVMHTNCLHSDWINYLLFSRWIHFTFSRWISCITFYTYCWLDSNCKTNMKSMCVFVVCAIWTWVCISSFYQ